MEVTLFRTGSVTWVERVFGLILVIPVIGLFDEALGQYSDRSFTAGIDRLLNEPALVQSIVLSIWVAVVSLAISISLARYLSGQCVTSGSVRRWQSLLLAIPHSALALGLLLALSSGGVGWRWVSQLLELSADHQYLFPRDPWGLGLIASLVVKETAFLTAIAIPIAQRLPLASYRALSRQAGLTQTESFNQLIWPQVLSLMKPALFVVFVFGLTNLEVSLILGPDQPQVFAVRLFQLVIDPNPLNRQAGSLGLIVLLLSLGVAWLIFRRVFRTRLHQERMVHHTPGWVWLSIDRCLIGLVCLSLLSLLLWSITQRWSVADVLPVMSFRLAGLAPLVDPMIMSLMIGCTTTVLSVGLAIVVLEYQVFRGYARLHWVWWAFLWMPALPMSAGLLAWIYLLGGAPGLGPVILGHTLIALPYVMIVMSDAWFARDLRYQMILNQSGLARWRAVIQIWIPRHSRLLLIAAALAFSVSCALYTQTVLLGGGRIETLMTELMVAVSGERRIAAFSGLMNLLLPLMAFVLVQLVNQWSWRNRIGMQGEGDADFR